MNWSLFDKQGTRKYLTHSERSSFIRSAIRVGGPTGAFCLTVALTGARISEVLNLTASRIDAEAGIIVIETLKRRERGIFRAMPVPPELIRELKSIHATNDASVTARLWPWSRTTGWKRIKAVMRDAGIADAVSMPKALRHAFGIEAVQNRIALSLVKKWLGHTKIETTAIYAEPVGAEERALARLMWTKLPRRARR